MVTDIDESYYNNNVNAYVNRKNRSTTISLSSIIYNSRPSPVRSQWIKLFGMSISRKKLLKVMRYTIVLTTVLAMFFHGNFNEFFIRSISNDNDNVPRDPLKFSGPSTARQKAVVKGFLHGWKGYRNYAWGHDELKPFSLSWDDWLHLGSTLVDSLDTMYIMGLHREFEDARLWVKDKLSFQGNHSVSVFETTIRILGGLLSAYHLSGDQLFLDKSVALGQRLLPVFKTPTGIPYSDINLGSGLPNSPHTGEFVNSTATSEATTLQLEFRELSRASGISIFEESAFRVSEIVHELPKREGLVPNFINHNTGQFIEKSSFSMAGRADSYYEYLLKQWIQTGRTIDFLREDYEEAIAGAQKLLVRHSKPSNFLIVGELNEKDEYVAKLHHLTCFLPGTLALGVHYGMPKEHLKFAEDLLNTCYQNYAIEPTHLAPENTYFNLDENISSDMVISEDSARYTLLRPETVESLWYLYVFTGNTTYQDWGWEIFQAIENGARMEPSGYSSLTNVDPGSALLDKLESFFFGETLKYLYLLFGDRNDDDHKLLSLDKFVVTTEAHFLPIHSS